MIHLKQKIKVLIVINDLAIGGAEKLVVDQLKYFNREKYEYLVLTLFSFPKEKNFITDLPSDIAFRTLDFKGFIDVFSWSRLIWIVWKYRTEVVVSHLFFSNTVMRILQPFFSYRVLSVEHNTYIHKAHWEIITDRILSHFSYKIIAVSKTVKEFASIQAGIPESKFAVISNGIDVQAIRRNVSTSLQSSELKKTLGFSEVDKLIINVARLAPQKNQRLLIKAFAQFSSQNPEYKLVILGEGSIRLDLEALTSELGISHKVAMPGIKNPYPYYLASEFFVLTSEIEGFAIVGIEAMACGLPVVSTRTAGPDEYIVDGENGFLVGNTIEDVVEGMEAVIQGNMQIMKYNAERAAEKYAINSTVHAYEELFAMATRVHTSS